jgi:hypothetical protein
MESVNPAKQAKVFQHRSLSIDTDSQPASIYFPHVVGRNIKDILSTNRSSANHC